MMTLLLKSLFSVPQPVLVGCLSSFAVMCGWIPTFAPQSFQISFTTIAVAQNPQTPTITPEEIKNYARAALMIEQARRQLEEEIGHQNIQGLSCESLDNNVDRAIVNSCRKFGEFVQSNNLSNERFNLIYGRQQQDPTLARSILREMAGFCIDSSDALAPSFCQQTVRVQMKKQCENQGNQIAPQICSRLQD
jgi:hypothetical protein